jgi:hypothetical protein
MPAMRRTTLIAVGFLIATITFPDDALAVEPWEGIWAAEKDWCRYAAEIGSHDPAPVRITSSKIQGLENTCDVTDVTKISKLQVWIIDMACSGEGERYDDGEVFLITSDDLLLRYTRDGYAIKMHRCSSD